MKLFVLTIMVAVVYSHFSCTHSEFEEQRFKEIPEQYFKDLIREAEIGIDDTDCTQSYKVEFKPGKTPFYLFNIKRQDLSRVYGIINGKRSWKPNWHHSDKDEFLFFLKKCNGTGTMAHVNAFKHFGGFRPCKNATLRNRPLRYYPLSPQGLIEKMRDKKRYMKDNKKY